MAVQAVQRTQKKVRMPCALRIYVVCCMQSLLIIDQCKCPTMASAGVGCLSRQLSATDWRWLSRIQLLHRAPPGLRVDPSAARECYTLCLANLEGVEVDSC